MKLSLNIISCHSREEFSFSKPLISIFNLIIFTFCFSVVFAQQPTEEWVARYPGPSNDLYGPFLQVDKQGNSYIAGTHVVNDTINILCTKYNTSGVQLWAKLYKYPGESFFTPTGLALDSSGNAYISARSAINSFQAPNTLTVKYNGVNGAVVWVRKYVGQFGRSYPLDMKINRTDHIYVVGWSDSSHLIIKYNTDGDSLWVRRYNLPGTRDMAYACTIDDSLNIIITGIREYCVTFPPPGGCFDTLLAAKYSSNGALRWITTYRYNNSGASGLKVVSDQNGNVYVGGSTAVSGYGVYLTLKYDRNGIWQWGKIYDAPGNGDNYFTTIVFNNYDNSLFITGISFLSSVGSIATIKYNGLTGDSIWVRRGIGTSYSSGGWDVMNDPSGNAYIAGGISATSSSLSDFLTMKYSSQGNQLWLVTYNGPFNGTDGGRALSLDTALNVYILGYSQSSSTVSDYVMIKYSQFLGIQPVSNEIPTVFKLEQNYPNPFNNKSKIKYQIAKSSFVTLEIFDVLGREVESLVNEELRPGIYLIDFDGTNYSSGIYFYKLIVEGNTIDAKKLVLLK